MATRRGDERDREPRRRPADRIEREETRPSRDDPRAARDDPRGDPRGAREEARGPRIPGLGEYFLPGDGIDRQVLQVELCKFLGSEAIARPGEYNVWQPYRPLLKPFRLKLTYCRVKRDS